MLQSQERQFLLNLILNAQEDAVALVSVKGNIVWSNRYAKDLLSWKGREEPDQPIYEIWPWGADALERVVRLVQRGRSIQYTTEYEDAGQMRWFDIRVHPVQDFHGANTRFLAICRDVTNERLTAREAMTHRALVEASRDCILITDEQGQIRYSNATSRKILKLADRPQSKADELIVSIDGSELTEEIYAAVNARGPWDGRLLLNDPENPSSMLYEGHVYPIGGKQSEIGLGWILRDITEQSVLERDLRQSNIEVTKSNILLEEKVALVEEQSTALMIQKEALTRLNHELKQLSETDYLTKIKNRRYGLSAASRMLIQRQRAQTSVGCIMFDIDHFKSINDTHGHAVGDQVLVAVTRAAQVVLDSTSVFARWGGEEFIIFLPDSSLYRTGVVAEKIRAEIQRAPIAGVLVTSSFGISASLEDEEDPEQLIERADTALYASKRGGRNRTTAWSNYLAEKLPATCYRLDYELHQHSA
jgi:diguanylate cyclase (GGDEF)-like protein/PAS domain S-box-containing protein